MVAHPDARQAPIPLNSLIFGYGPMIPFLAAAGGAWLLPAPWPTLALRLAILWGGLILAFLAGVRRGFGFGSDRASTPVAIGTMLLYFIPAGLALLLGSFGAVRAALLLLATGFALVALCDSRAARHGDAPAHFARLRGPQLSLAILSLLALAARTIV